MLARSIKKSQQHEVFFNDSRDHLLATVTLWNPVKRYGTAEVDGQTINLTWSYDGDGNLYCEELTQLLPLLNVGPFAEVDFVTDECVRMI